MKTVEHLMGRAIGKYADHPDRILQPGILMGNIMPEILDNLPLPAQTVEAPGYNPELVDRVVSPQLRDTIRDLIKDWGNGEAHGAIVAVGGVDTGSSHPHLFEVTKSEAGARLLFVDPENRVGDRNPLKPAIMIMGATIIPFDPNGIATVDFVRFRSMVYHNPKDISLPSQYREAEDLTSEVGLPKTVVEHPESITYRLSLREHRRLLRARYATREQIRRILEGKISSTPLEFRIKALRDTFDLFPRFATEDSVESERYRHFIDKMKKAKEPSGLEHFRGQVFEGKNGKKEIRK